MSLRRSNSNPVLSFALRRHVSSSAQARPSPRTLIKCTSATREASAIGIAGAPSITATSMFTQKRLQHRHDGPSDRNKAAHESFNDSRGEAITFHGADLRDDAKFDFEPASAAKVPELTDEERNRSERQRLMAMKQKYGELGPGGEMKHSLTAHRHKELKVQQDIDGLPWEVRWRKESMPSPEEVISEVRDRFELNYPDPIEREQRWFMHWKDRDYSMAEDRLIWPQGYTDYLDKYDEFGRRRVLPSDQKWSDSSWKHLSDVNHRERLFLMDSLERKHFLETLRGKEKMMEKEEAILLERSEMEHGVKYGVIDLNPDQTYEKLAGTADPVAIREVKTKVALHGIKTHKLIGKELPAEKIDPVTSLPKADIEPLSRTGLTVEQAAMVVNRVTETVDAKLDSVHKASSNIITAGMDVIREQLEMGKKAGGKAVHQVAAEKAIEHVRIARGDHLQQQRGHMGLSTNALEQLEAGLEESAISSDPTTDDGPLHTSDGYMDVRLARGLEDVPDEGPLHSHSRKPADLGSGGLEQWYDENAAKNSAEYITEYGLTNDPIESKPIFVGGNGTSAFGDGPEPVTPETNPYLRQPSARPKIRADKLSSLGVSAFDQGRFNREGVTPELQSELKPLPLYRDVKKKITPETGHPHTFSPEPEHNAEADVQDANDGLTRRQRRLSLERKKKLTVDQELMLPDLPWESGMIEDNKRGIAERDEVPFDREAVSKTYKAYRDFLLQSMYEFTQISRKVIDVEILANFINEKIQRVRKGDVAEHPAIEERQTEVLKLLFESNLLRFQSDFCEANDHEKQALKHRSDDVGKAAIAKAKVLGPSMSNFLHEASAAEQEEMRKNPINKSTAYATDKAFNPVVKPFTDWYNAHIYVFENATFDDEQQITQHAQSVMKALGNARNRCVIPSSDPSNPALTHAHFEAVRDSFSNWCLGLVHNCTGKHYISLMRKFANSTFRGLAEREFSEANDHFYGAYKCSGNGKLCVLPVPNSIPTHYYDETSFTALDGGTMEIPIYAERNGNMDVAEAGWATGSNNVWYPMVDETELMLFKERRGIFSEVLSISERCLDNLNKKTHPSVHPFPEKAYKYLEGAPLTRETAEHLWMRYMGMVYWEHAEVHQRLMQFATAKKLRQKSLSFLYAAVELADKSLPKTWKAPLLTKAIYLMKAQTETEDIEKHILDVDAVVDALYEVEVAEQERIAALQERKRKDLTTKGHFLSSTAHWVDSATMLPYRIALVNSNVAAYRVYVAHQADKLSPPISDRIWEKAAEARFRGEDPKKTIPEISKYERIVDELTEELFGKKIKKWLALEKPESIQSNVLKLLYFAVKGKTSADPKEAEELWQFFKPAIERFYTNVCLDQRHFGEAFMTRAIRTMFFILSASDSDNHKKMLRKELQNLLDKIPSVIDPDEMRKCIVSLEAHMLNKSKPLYCYMSAAIQKELELQAAAAENPDLYVTTKEGEKQRRQVEEQLASIRSIK